MGTRTEHAPGTFSWVDLTTSDAAGAKEFYGALLGWDFEDNEIPGGGTYTMCRVGGEYVAAIPDSTDQHPPHWNSYVTVAGADETAAEAAAARRRGDRATLRRHGGGPDGAPRRPDRRMLCVWEPGESIGAGRVNDPGCLTWIELHTPDPARALEFYTGLFGWNTEEMDTQGGPVLHDRQGRRALERRGDGRPAGRAPELAALLRRRESRPDGGEGNAGLGARELFRMEMPQGRIAVFSDPQGAPFAVWEGETDD